MKPEVLYGLYVSFAAAMGAFLLGYQLGFLSTVIATKSFETLFLEHTKDHTVPAAGIIGAAFTGGNIPGCLLLAYIGDRIGRKLPLLLGGILAIIGIIVQTSQTSDEDNVRTNNVYMFAVGRFIAGIGTGMLSMTVPIFISEIAPTNLRGRLTTINQLMITIGIFVASLSNAIIYAACGDDTKVLAAKYVWRIMVGLQLVPAVVLIGMLVFITESPISLLNRGKEQEALNALRVHRCAKSSTEPEIVREFAEMQLVAEDSRKYGKSSWGEILEPSLRRRVVVASMLQFFQQWSGINALLTYSGVIFKSVNLEEYESNVFLIPVLNLVNFISTFPAMFLIERLGRSRLLAYGGVGMCVCFAILTACFENYFVAGTGDIKDTFESKTAAWICLGAIYAYIFFFAASWGPVVWTYQSEIFPIRVRSKCAGIATAVNWINAFILIFVFPIMQKALREHLYITFVVTTAAMAAYSFFLVPETKGLEMEGINRVFGRTGSSESKTIA